MELERKRSTILLCKALRSSKIDMKLCQNLVKKGADLDVIEQQRGTPCIPRVYWDVKLIKFFLDHGRDVNARNEDGNTALVEAASRNIRIEVEFLLQNSADPNVRNRNGETALYQLIKYRSTKATDVAKILIEGGADVNTYRTNQGLTLLHLEQFDPVSLECVLDKFENNIDIRASKLNYEKTPLMVAARRGNVELCRALIERNADVNAQNCYGFTPLHYAVYSLNLECVQLLLSSGSDPNIKSKSGLDAFDMHRFAPSTKGNVRIFEEFEDSIKRITIYEIGGAEYILQNNILAGCKLWKMALKMRTDLNLPPKPEPSEKQKTVYKIQNWINTKEQLEDLRTDEESMYRHALLTIDSNSNGSIWFLFRSLVYLLNRFRANDSIKLRFVTEMLRYISENIDLPECVDNMDDEFNKESSVLFFQTFILEFRTPSIDQSDAVTGFVRDSVPFILNIYYHLLRLKCNRKQVPNTIELESALNLVELIQRNRLEQILRSHIKDFFTKIAINLIDLKDENGDTLLHLACNSLDYYYSANVLVDSGANVNELNNKNQEPIQLINGKNIDCNLVLKMVERGAHLDAKPEYPVRQGAFQALRKNGTNTLPYVSLKCMAARVLAQSWIRYKGVLPEKLTEFVNLHSSENMH